MLGFLERRDDQDGFSPEMGRVDGYVYGISKLLSDGEWGRIGFSVSRERY